MTVTIICGMTQEAAIAKEYFKKSQIIQYQHTAGFRLEDHIAKDCKKIWSFGLCGGNAIGFPVGAIGVARSLVDDTGRQYIVDRAMRALVALAAGRASMHVGMCPWLSTATMDIGDNVAARAALLKKYGAWADDDETYYIATFANPRGIPMGIVRSCSDDWRMNLPKLVTGALNPDGSMNESFVFRSLIGNPSQIPAALRTAYAYEHSLNTLKDAAAVLAPTMEG